MGEAARMMPRRRGWLILLGLLVLLPVAALGLLAGVFDPGAYEAQAMAAVRRATGRDLTFNGPVSVSWGLSPVFAARDVTLANIDGGSRPEMMRIERLEARVSLLPLLWHSLYVRQLLLVHPDLLLERNARGEPNWRPGPARPASAAAAPEVTQESAPDIGIAGEVRIENGTVTWREGGRD